MLFWEVRCCSRENYRMPQNYGKTRHDQVGPHLEITSKGTNERHTQYQIEVKSNFDTRLYFLTVNVPLEYRRSYRSETLKEIILV